MSFQELELDPRLQRAIAKLGFDKPTLVQETAIPLALQGKDILARARTGSGKTAAYLIPVIQKILSKGKSESVQALILVPTKELSEQVTGQVKQLAMYCNSIVDVVNISSSVNNQLSISQELPAIFVSTPSRIRQHLDEGKVELKNLESLVIDEADLILSFGYDQDVTTILNHLPQIYQSYLMSATLSKDVEKLKKLVLRNPAILQLEEEDVDSLTQYQIKCSQDDKYLFMLFMLKLRIHPFGSQKTIIFVNSIDRCYKLKLFLEQFGIKSCALNSELPAKSRFHIVQEFNRGVYDYIIATDEGNEMKHEVVDSDEEVEEFFVEKKEGDVGEENPEAPSKGEDPSAEKKESEKEVPSKGGKKKKKKRQDQDYGVSRGIDFQNVTAVINFDMPRTSRNYQHRVGRTARGVGNKGYALSFVCPPEETIVHTRKKVKSSSKPKLRSDEEILARIEKRQEALGRVLLPFKFDMEPVERFRYRCQDALRTVTDAAVREARIKEIKQEILNSEKLKAHFEDNPNDLKALRHDKAVHPTRVQPQLRHVPNYLLPKGKVAVQSGESTGYVPFRMDKKRRGNKKFKKPTGTSQKRKQDPLKSFQFQK